MKVQGRTIEYFELPVYIQKVEEHNLHKDDFLKLFHKAPWWDIFVLTIDKYIKNVASYFDSKWTSYKEFWVDGAHLGLSDVRSSHYTFLYFWHDNQLTLKSNGKSKVIDVTEGELIAFPSLLRYEFKNDTVTGYDVTFREDLNN